MLLKFKHTRNQWNTIKTYLAWVEHGRACYFSAEHSQNFDFIQHGRDYLFWSSRSKITKFCRAWWKHNEFLSCWSKHTNSFSKWSKYKVSTSTHDLNRTTRLAYNQMSRTAPSLETFELKLGKQTGS